MFRAPKFRLGMGPCALAFAGLTALAAATAPAAVITSSNIVTVPKGTVGSGNGTLDFLLLTESNGGASNSSGSFNGDNANTAMPSGGSNLTADESYITSFGEIRNFFILNFPNGSGGSTVNELVVMVDVNETGGPQTINLNTFDIWLNASVTPPSDTRNDPANVDINSGAQNGTDNTFFGGTKIANLDSPKVLGQVETGAGFPDKAIFTGINPFSTAYADSDRFLLHWTSADHDNGGESVFISGAIGPGDLIVPEPASMGLLMIGAMVATLSRRSRSLAR